MEALADRCVGSQYLQPLFVILMQAIFVVVDEDAGRDVWQYGTLHGIYRNQCLPCGIPLSHP
jgi:hypothetical protein